MAFYQRSGSTSKGNTAGVSDRDGDIFYIDPQDLSDVFGDGIAMHLEPLPVPVWMPKTSDQLFDMYRHHAKRLESYTSTMPPRTTGHASSPAASTATDTSTISHRSLESIDKNSSGRPLFKVVRTDSETGVPLVDCDASGALGWKSYDRPCGICDYLPSKSSDGHAYMWAVPEVDVPGKRKMVCEQCWMRAGLMRDLCGQSM